MKEFIEFVRVHPEFKLNGKSHSISSLKDLAYNFKETGKPFEQSVGEFLLDWLDNKKYVFAKTSGSTGDPKEIKILKNHMFNSAQATAKHFKIQEKTKALLCLPAHYIAGKMMLVRAMVLGWHIDTVLPSIHPLESVYKEYDFCAITPMQLDNSLSKLHLLKKVIVGGGVVSVPLAQKIQHISTKVYETYGMTETVTHIAARHINPKKEELAPIPFKILSKVSIETDKRGCLVINAPEVSLDIIVTNDLVEIHTKETFIWLGRVDNVINSGGVKLYPEQIENKLASFIDIPFFISSIPDAILGEQLVLFIEQEEAFDLEISTLDKEVFKIYEFPKKIISLSLFNRTKSGKVQRNVTVKKYLENL